MIPFTKPSFEKWFNLLTDDEIIHIDSVYAGNYEEAYMDEISYMADCAYDAWRDDKLTGDA